jgi:hypothetical protein
MNRKICLLLLFFVALLSFGFSQENSTNQTAAASNATTAVASSSPEPVSGYLCQKVEDTVHGDLALIQIENQKGISFAATKGDAKESIDSKSFQVNIYDSSRKLLGSLNTDTHKQSIVSLVQLGTTEKLLSCARDKTIELWSLKENTRLKDVKLEQVDQVVACYHQEAKKSVLIVTISGLLHEVSEDTWEVTKNYTSLNESVIVNSAEFVADSNRVVLGTISNGLYIYSLESDKVEANVKLNPNSTESRIEAIESLPGSGKVVVANQSPKLYVISVVDNTNGTIFKEIELGEKALVKPNGIYASQKADSVVVVESQAINVFSPLSDFTQEEVKNQTESQSQPSRFLSETLNSRRRTHRKTIRFVDTTPAANSTEANSTNTSAAEGNASTNASDNASTNASTNASDNASTNASGNASANTSEENTTAPEPVKPKPLVPENWTEANPAKEVKSPKENYRFTYFTSEGSLPRGPATWKNHELIVLGNQGALVFDFSYENLDDSKGKCLVPCSIDQYGNDTERSCKKCHHKCKSCSGPSEFDCLTCNFDDFLFHSTCTSGCVDGTKADLAKKTCTCIEPKIFRKGRCVIDQSGGSVGASSEDKSKKTGIIVAVIIIGFIFIAIIVGLCWKFCEPPRKDH